MRYILAALSFLFVSHLMAEAKPVDGFGPRADNEPVLVNPLSENIGNVDEDVIEQLRTRIRNLDDDIALKLQQHKGVRPRQYVLEDLPELREEQALRDVQWQAFMDAVRNMNGQLQRTDILDKPSRPQIGRQERMLIALNKLEAAECYRELNQQGESKIDDIRRSAKMAKSIELEDLPPSDQARLLYLRCVLAMDRSRWEAAPKQAGFLQEAHQAYQLLKASHPNSLLTTNAGHLLEDHTEEEDDSDADR